MTKIAKLDLYSVLEVKGKDSEVFLQGQLSQDLSSIELENAKWFGLSNAKGRLLAVGQVYRAEENCYWLIMPTEIAEIVQPYLLRFKFRSKVEFQIRDDLHVYGCWGDGLDHPKHQYRLGTFADLYILLSKENLDTSADTREWTEQKIMNGLPDVFQATQEKFVAQMLNLDLINAISFNKGCYTGQEIIARMQHLGRIKRRMLTLELSENMAVGDTWKRDDQSLGQVVNSVKSGDKFLTLVCVQLDKLQKTSIENISYNYDIPELNVQD